MKRPNSRVEDGLKTLSKVIGIFGMVLFLLSLSARGDTTTVEEVTSQKERQINPNRVVPVIKSANWVAQLSLEQRQKIVLRPLTKELFVALAEDTPGTLVYLSPAELIQLGWSAEDEKVNSVINLGRILPRFQIRGSEGFFMITAGGNYEASMLIAPLFWEKLKKELHGYPVVGIPNRDLFFVTGSQDKEGLASLRTIVADSYAKGDYPLSDKLFILSDQGISLFP